MIKKLFFFKKFMRKSMQLTNTFLRMMHFFTNVFYKFLTHLALKRNQFSVPRVKFIFLLAFVPSCLFAANLTQSLNALKSMQANFNQTTFDNHGKTIQQSTGKMALSRPGKFRWDVSRPIPQLIIANGSRLWIYDKDLEQVTIRPLSSSAGETPALLLSHENNSIENDFKVTSRPPKSDNLTWFVLTPKSADNNFAQVEMGFVKEEIRQMRLQDHLGHTTLVKFTQAKVNQSVPAGLFVFHVPKNTDVIDETKRGR